MGFPRTPFLTVAENLPLYRQSQFFLYFQIFLGIPVEKMGHNAVEGKGDRAADGECRGAFQLRGGNDHNGIAAASADVEMDGAAHHLADVHGCLLYTLTLPTTPYV